MSRHSLALVRSSGIPLWKQLRDDLVRRLEDGEFPDRFPGELELVDAYQVSRHTVREALRRLREDGVIESSRGRSSVARPRVIHQGLGAMYSLFQEFEARGIVQRSRVIAFDHRADEEAAHLLGLSPDTELVYLERIRYGDDEPIAWDRAWLDPILAAPLLNVDFSRTGIYGEWVRAADLRLSSGSESIRAIVPGEEQRALLEMDDDEAALEIVRSGRLGERQVEHRITLVRGSRFAFSAEWSSGRAYSVEVSG